MNYSFKALKASPTWKRMTKTMRWVFLGKWDQADESVFLEMSEKDKSFKPKQNLLKNNAAAQKVWNDRETARKEAKKARAARKKKRNQPEAEADE